ncbi:MAG TPA: hypothetical protein VGQ31_00660 [Candidatus Limnocylindrales bacterium]|nr:hypothetical protein [Candidatus Limnocylindrales bacterium]
MNAVSIIYVNAHLEDLRSEARDRRLAASLADKPSLRARLAAAAASLRRTLGADEIGPTFPQLSHWPYRV